MLDRRTLIFILATVLGSLADYEFLKDRRGNYNSNANNNQLFGGFNGGFGRDVVNDRDRGMTYANPTKYNGVPKSGVGSGKDRGGLYVSPKYILRGTGDGGSRPGGFGAGSLGAEGLGAGGFATGGFGDLDAGGFGAGDSRAEGFESGYDTISDEIGYGGGYGDEICDNIYNTNPNNQPFRYLDDEEKAVSEEPTDDDGSPEGLFIYNSNYNVVFKGNRRVLGLQPYDGTGSWGNNVNSNANNNVIRSRYRRTNNWGPLRTNYYIEREPTTYVTELQPSYTIDRQPNYMTDRQTAYVTDRQSLYSTERQPIYSGELRPYPTTLRPVDDDYERGYRGPNMNSNVNYNLLTGRRSNINSNANNNEIRYGGYGQSRPNDRYHTTPSYSSYDQEGYKSDRNQGSNGGYGNYATKRNRPSEYRKRPRFNVDNDDDDDEKEEDDDYGRFGNANINSNSNMNIVSRRNNPRNRRSVENPPKKSDRVGRPDNDGTTKILNSESSTTHGPMAEKWENPILYQEAM